MSSSNHFISLRRFFAKSKHKCKIQYNVHSYIWNLYSSIRYPRHIRYPVLGCNFLICPWPHFALLFYLRLYSVRRHRLSNGRKRDETFTGETKDKTRLRGTARGTSKSASWQNEPSNKETLANVDGDNSSRSYECVSGCFCFERSPFRFIDTRVVVRIMSYVAWKASGVMGRRVQPEGRSHTSAYSTRLTTVSVSIRRASQCGLIMSN